MAQGVKSAGTASLLDELRRRGFVDCDTMDLGVAQEFGPFVNCTSNQAIALRELSKKTETGQLVHKQLMSSAIAWAWDVTKTEPPFPPPMSREALAVEFLMAHLLIRMAPHLRGFVLFQVDPNLAEDTNKIIAAVERVRYIVMSQMPDFDVRRFCFKIIATWPGLCACKELQARGIRTLATSVFCLEQAAVAGAAGCWAIAPYINELRVHFDQRYEDRDKGFELCHDAVAYYNARGLRTCVMAASFISAREVIQMAGLDYLTIPPPIIRELADTPVEAVHASQIGSRSLSADGHKLVQQSRGFFDDFSDERGWCEAVYAHNSRKGRKLNDAIMLFCNEQTELETLIRHVRAQM